MMRPIALAWLMAAVLITAAAAQPAATLAERTRGLERLDGFVPLYWDAARGRVLAEVPAFDRDVFDVMYPPRRIASLLRTVTVDDADRVWVDGTSLPSMLTLGPS